MESLELLARVVLPEEIFLHFDIVGVDKTPSEIHIHLDERARPELQNDIHYESKGFRPAVSITDFPIRDHKVLLKVRSRRWLDTRTGKSFSFPINLTADGTRYSKEFASFLKETYGCFPDNLPYA